MSDLETRLAAAAAAAEIERLTNVNADLSHELIERMNRNLNRFDHLEAIEQAARAYQEARARNDRDPTFCTAETSAATAVAWSSLINALKVKP